MARRRDFFVPIPDGISRYGPGRAAVDYDPGDFILTHGDSWTSKLIRFGQRLRIHGDDRKYTHWNHAAMIVSGDGDLVEALGRGVTRTHISKYKPTEYHVVRIGANAEDRAKAAMFAEWASGEPVACSGQDLISGPQRYGFLTIFAIAYTLLTGGKFTFALEGQMICSGLVARCMERTGAIFTRTPTHIVPADLALYYDIQPPQ